MKYRFIHIDLYWIWLKELSLRHKIKFSNPYFFETCWGNPDQELGRIEDQGLKNNIHLVKMKEFGSFLHDLIIFHESIESLDSLQSKNKVIPCFGRVYVGKEWNFFFNGTFRIYSLERFFRLKDKEWKSVQRKMDYSLYHKFAWNKVYFIW